MFAGKGGGNPSELLLGAPSLWVGSWPSLRHLSRVKSLPGTNALAYYEKA